MKKNILIVVVTFIVLLLSSENPTSENYILQQSSVASGNDPANPPTSENYILKSSAIGNISGEQQTSASYANLPGYYLGPIIGEILPPENVTISVSGGNVYLTWDAVTNANSYRIYSSNNPNESFELWNLEASGITITSWNQTLQNAKKFYCVVSSTGSSDDRSIKQRSTTKK